MSNTNIAITTVLFLAVLAGGYVFYTQSDDNMTPAASGITGSTTATTTGADQEQTLQRLNNLESIEIDAEFLNSSTFTSLENFGISIEPQPVGRSNPFQVVNSAVVPEVSENSVNIEAAENSTEQSESTATTSVDQLLESGPTSTQNATTSTQGSQ